MGASAKVTFHAGNARRAVNHIENELGKRLRKCAEMLRTEVVQSISTPTRSAGPSSPHTPPHADTGMLRKSIERDIDTANLTARVGTTLDYGAFLEHGTSRMEPREYLLPAAKKLAPQLAKILTAPIK